MTHAWVTLKNYNNKKIKNNNISKNLESTPNSPELPAAKPPLPDVAQSSLPPRAWKSRHPPSPHKAGQPELQADILKLNHKSSQGSNLQSRHPGMLSQARKQHLLLEREAEVAEVARAHLLLLHSNRRRKYKMSISRMLLMSVKRKS